MHHGVDAVVLGGFCACHGKRRSLDRRHDGVPAGLVLINDCTVPTDLNHIPAELLYPTGNGFAVVVYTNDGERLSKYVTCFDSNYQTSKYVYDDISDNIEDLIEDALSNKAPQ